MPDQFMDTDAFLSANKVQHQMWEDEHAAPKFESPVDEAGHPIPAGWQTPSSVASDPSTGKPNSAQVVQWEEATPKGQKYKGFMDVGNGPQPVYGTDIKEDPAVTEQKLRQHEAKAQEVRSKFDERRKSSRRERLNETQKFTRSLVRQEGAGYMSRNKLNDREFSSELLSDPKVKNHPYTSYSKRERDKFESEIAKGKDKRNLTGLSDYERDKTNYEATVRSVINERKGHEWESKKFAQFDLQLEQQRLNLEQTKVGIEATKQNIENSKSLVEYRKQQEKLKNARDELARRAKLNKQLNDDSTTASDAYRIVQEGGGVSKERAEAIAKRLPPAHRRAFIDKAVANMEEATRPPRDLLESYRTPDKGGGRAGKISSTEAAKVRKSAQEAKDAGISPKAGIRLAAESIGETGNPAAESAAIKAYSEPSENDVTAQRESEEYVAKQMDEYNNVIASFKKLTTDTSDDRRLVDFVLRYSGATFGDFLDMDDDDIQGLVERGIMGGLSEDNENGKATFRARLDSRDSSEEQELVDRIKTRMTTFRKQQDSVIGNIAAKKSIAIAESMGRPADQFVTAATVDGKTMTAYTGGDKDFADVMSKHLNDAMGRGKEVEDRLKYELGYSSQTGLFGTKAATEEGRERISKLNFSPPPEAALNMFPSKEGKDAARELWLSGDDYAREVINATGSGKFDGVLLKKASAVLNRVSKLVPELDSDTGPEAVATATKWTNDNFGKDSAIRKKVLAPIMLGAAGVKDVGKPAADRIREMLDKRLDMLSKIDLTPLFGDYYANKRLSGNTGSGVKVGALIRDAILASPAIRQMWYSGSERAMEAALMLGMVEAENEEKRKIVNNINLIGALTQTEGADKFQSMGLQSDNLHDAVSEALEKADKGPFGLNRNLVSRMCDVVSSYYDNTAKADVALKASTYRVRQLGGVLRFHDDNRLDEIRINEVRVLTDVHRDILQSLDSFIAKKNTSPELGPLDGLGGGGFRIGGYSARGL